MIADHLRRQPPLVWVVLGIGALLVPLYAVAVNALVQAGGSERVWPSRASSDFASARELQEALIPALASCPEWVPPSLATTNDSDPTMTR